MSHLAAADWAEQWRDMCELLAGQTYVCCVATSLIYIYISAPLSKVQCVQSAVSANGGSAPLQLYRLI